MWSICVGAWALLMWSRRGRGERRRRGWFLTPPATQEIRCRSGKGASIQMKGWQVAFIPLWWIAEVGWGFQLRTFVSCLRGWEAGHCQWIAGLRRLWCSGRRNQIHVKFGNNGRPVVLKLLKPVYILCTVGSSYKSTWKLWNRYKWLCLWFKWLCLHVKILISVYFWYWSLLWFAACCLEGAEGIGVFSSRENPNIVCAEWSARFHKKCRRSGPQSSKELMTTSCKKFGIFTIFPTHFS